MIHFILSLFSVKLMLDERTMLLLLLLLEEGRVGGHRNASSHPWSIRVGVIVLGDSGMKPTGCAVLVIDVVRLSLSCECFLPAIGERGGGF